MLFSKKIIICDIDGTISDYKHRIHFIKRCREDAMKVLGAADPSLERHNYTGPDWDSFNNACIDDPPIKNVIEILRQFDKSAAIVLMTGRSERYALPTLAWLKRNRIPYDAIHMRRQGDFRSDVEVKREIFERVYIPERILFVLEDRDKLVTMWRELGLTCLQVAKGEY